MKFIALLMSPNKKTTSQILHKWLILRVGPTGLEPVTR
jgi:hypothetical protein